MGAKHRQGIGTMCTKLSGFTYFSYVKFSPSARTNWCKILSIHALLVNARICVGHVQIVDSFMSKVMFFKQILGFNYASIKSYSVVYVPNIL